MTNQIVGDDDHGYYYVDTTGIKITDKTVKRAVALVKKLTKDSWSSDKKLKTCYTYFWKSCKYQRFYDKVSIKKMPSYADYMLKNKQGNCYRGAAALAYVAKVLGYDVRVAVGGVTSRSQGALSLHGWTEVKDKDTWKMCDISMQRPRPNTSLYMLQEKEYPFRHRCDDRYKLVIKNGKVQWKKNS